MDEDTIKQLKAQHIENYKKAILDNIKNNTRVLVNDDIKSLFNKPPLDSMDVIRNKFLDLAKKNKVVLNTEELDKILKLYRNDLSKCLEKIERERMDTLKSILDKHSFKDEEVFTFYKKDFINLNKSIKKTIKEELISANDIIISKIDKLFSKDIDLGVTEKIVVDITKYLKGNYQKQILENLDIKILVKDTTLINGIKEQADRYLFTLKNSKLLNLD